MALTRNFLKSMGLTDEQISAIIENHMDTVDGLKADRDALKAEAAKLTQAQAEVTRLTGELEKAQKTGGDAAKVQADFDAYKQQIAAERMEAATDAELAEIAKAAGIQRDSFRRMAVKTFDRALIKRGEDNAIANRDDLVAAMKQEYPDFIATDPAPTGAPPVAPPPGPQKVYTAEQIGKMTPEEINKNWDVIQSCLPSLK